MIIKSIRVRNFRCIRDETLPCQRLTVLVGPNGSGKSSFLRALKIFYEPNAKYTEDDFYARETSQPIIITVTFTELTEAEKELFRKYVEGDELTVEKELTWPPSRGSQKYYGTSLQNPEFDAFRSASGTDLRREYDKLRRKSKYSELPPYTNKEVAEQYLQQWELNHPKDCVRRRDGGQFFGFKEVGEAHLERYTKFIFIPAVVDPSEEAVEKKGSLLYDIMELVVRKALAKREDLAELRKDTEKKYENIMESARKKELHMLETGLTSILQGYFPGASGDLKWEETEIELPTPKAKVRLVEDNFPATVETVGHGLQRTFYLSMLQYLTIQSASVEKAAERGSSEGSKEKKEVKGQFDTSLPSVIIGIEEPELYQHPNRQRHLSEVLLKLATRTNQVSYQTQVIYSTHSPLFVDLERFDQIRIFRKRFVGNSSPKETKVSYTSFDDLARTLERIDNKPEGSYSIEGLKARLRTQMTPWLNEGFFADVVVLVEGEEDRAAILEIASLIGHDFEALGISILPCGGKDSLLKPAIIFRNLEIPIYVVWDSDYNPNSSSKSNHRLLKLFGDPIEDLPDKITDNFACFKQNLGEVLRREIGGDLFNEILRECCDELNITSRGKPEKNPQVIRTIIREAYSRGNTCKTLEEIVNRIVSLKEARSSREHRQILLL